MIDGVPAGAPPRPRVGARAGRRPPASVTASVLRGRSPGRLVALVGAALLSGCGGSSGDGIADVGSAPVVVIRGADGVDRGPDGYRLSVVRREQGDRETSFLRYVYDANGRILGESVLDRGEVSEVVVYEHDDEGHLLRRTEDDRETIVYRHAAGRVREIEDEDDYQEYRYDAAGRLSGLSVVFIDRGFGTPSGGERIPVGESLFVYRDGRLDHVVDSEPGEEARRVTRYEYEDGRLTRAITSFEGVEANGESITSIRESVTLNRDESGRLTGMTRARAAGARTERSFGYEADRLVSIRTVRRVSIDDGNSTSEVRFDYSDLGLIERATRTFVDDDTGTVTSSVSEYEYENEPCIGRASARPELELLGELYGIDRPVSAALDCGYWLRQSL